MTTWTVTVFIMVAADDLSLLLFLSDLLLMWYDLSCATNICVSQRALKFSKSNFRLLGLVSLCMCQSVCSRRRLILCNFIPIKFKPLQCFLCSACGLKSFGTAALTLICTYNYTIQNYKLFTTYWLLCCQWCQATFHCIRTRNWWKRKTEQACLKKNREALQLQHSVR